MFSHVNLASLFGLWNGCRHRWLTILIVACITLPPTYVAGQTKPNVVILLADDLGSRDIGCYGGPVKTPALDKLAANGIRFTNFYSGAPVCSTARATLLTGRHHLRTGVYTVIQDHIHDMHLLRREVTIAEHLRKHGYATAHFGKWHLGTPFRGRKKPWIDEHGFDYWFATDLNATPSHRNPKNFWRNRKRVGEIKGYACQIVVDEAISWLENRNVKEKPFFLNVWFHEPHAPLAAPTEIVKKYGKPNDPAAVYSATIENTDRAIDRFVKKLEARGELENTILIYMSDHGSYRQDRNGGLRNGKGSLLEGGIRTPGIFCWPKGISGGRVEDTPAGAIDILPTICGLAEIKNPEGVQLDGVDLTGLLTDAATKWKRSQPLSWHSPLSQPAAVIRDGRYCLVGWRSQDYPKDKAAIDRVMKEMRVILENQLGRTLTRAELWDKCYNTSIKTPEWKKLRSEFVTLNTFQEDWIPLIKDGSMGITRFELYDLSKDTGQRKNIAIQQPGALHRLQEKMLAIHDDVLEEAPVWGNGKPNIRVHRLKSKKRSALDAFIYVNRIPIEPDDDETPEDLSYRIFSRLANQEGRIQIKLPSTMNVEAYHGFKIALGTGKKLHSGRCTQCHRLPEFGNPKSKTAVPSLRNQKISIQQLKKILANETHRSIQLDEKDTSRLHQLLLTLRDVSDSDFRELIIQSTVLEKLGDK